MPRHTQCCEVLAPTPLIRILEVFFAAGKVGTSPGAALGLERPLSLQRHDEVGNGCVLHLRQALLILSRREVGLDLQQQSASCGLRPPHATSLWAMMDQLI